MWEEAGRPAPAQLGPPSSPPLSPDLGWLWPPRCACVCSSCSQVPVRRAGCELPGESHRVATADVEILEGRAGQEAGLVVGPGASKQHPGGFSSGRDGRGRRAVGPGDHFGRGSALTRLGARERRRPVPATLRGQSSRPWEPLSLRGQEAAWKIRSAGMAAPLGPPAPQRGSSWAQTSGRCTGT
ncbi:zinc finger protein 251 isoform X2 [Manis pentadactyla]|uniref:zinc finger protein 251 isoform X2 n=1 Tax=Manis pentadactyla TaxID=143292 RepID=UPI00255C5A13|nr:zinc finger protein 251 isoform X2 [Manis pentadactyla]